MKNFPYILIMIAVISCTNNGIDKDTFLELSVENDSATIGDLVEVEMLINDDQLRNFALVEPQVGDNWDIRSISDKGGKNGNRRIGINYVFWDTGVFTLPPINVALFHDNSDTSFIKTDSMKVTILSVLDQSTFEMKPIKGPVSLRTRITKQFVLLAVLALLSLVLIYIFWKKRNPDPKQAYLYEEPLNIVDPFKHAINRIKKLEQDVPIDVKEAYFQLTHILREFIENLYFVKALEMTTEELRKSRHLLPRISDENFEQLIHLLVEADNVKFARFQPGDEKWSGYIQFSKKIIENLNPQSTQMGS